MAKKKTRATELADEAIRILKDAIRDIEILGQGRGGHARYWAVQTQIWDAEKLIRELDPEKPKRNGQEASPERPMLEQKTLALEFKP